MLVLEYWVLAGEIRILLLHLLARPKAPEI